MSPMVRAVAYTGALICLSRKGRGADVVLVPVGDEDAADLGRVFSQIGEIRDDQIDTGQVVIREGGAAIHNKDILLGLKDSQVLAVSPRPPREMIAERGAAGAVGLFAAAGAAVGLLRGSGRLFAAALGSGLLFGRLAFGGLVLRRGLGLLFLGSFFAAALGCCLGLPSALPLAEEAFCSFLGSGLLFLGGLGLAGLAALALFGRSWPWPALASAGEPWAGRAFWPLILRAVLLRRRSLRRLPRCASPVRSPPRSRRRFWCCGSCGNTAQRPRPSFYGVLRQKPVHYSFFSVTRVPPIQIWVLFFIFGLMYDVRPPIPFRRSCVLIHDKILHLAQIFWFCFYYTA